MIDEATPVLSWQPTVTESAEEVRKLAANYTNGRRAFVVFRSGTVVYSDSERHREDADYIATLEAVIVQSPDFKVVPLQDGNLLVRFTGPVTGIVVASFYAANSDSIAKGIVEGGFLPGESIIAGESSEPSEQQYRAGLYARAKMYADAVHPEIAARHCP